MRKDSRVDSEESYSMGEGASNWVNPTDKKIVIATYALMMASPILWFTPLVAIIIAYVQRGDASELCKSHYKNAISVFWISAIMLVLGAFISFGLIGMAMSGNGLGLGVLLRFLGLVFTGYIYYRLIKGLVFIIKEKSWG